MSLPDNLACPSCHELMEKGFVRSTGGLHWMTDETTGRYVPQMSGESLFAENEGSFESLRFTAARCRECAVLLMKYVEVRRLPEG
jgi:hypothetical protein